MGRILGGTGWKVPEGDCETQLTDFPAELSLMDSRKPSALPLLLAVQHVSHKVIQHNGVPEAHPLYAREASPPPPPSPRGSMPGTPPAR